MYSKYFIKKCKEKIDGYHQTDKKKFGIYGDLKVEDIQELLIKQDNKCYVCNDALLLESWTPHCLYQFSCDRINENLPHDRDNFLISCYYCNCTMHLRDESKKKCCINGCHTEERFFEKSRTDILANIKDSLKLSQNIGRDIQINEALIIQYNKKISNLEYAKKQQQNTILNLLIKKRLYIYRLFEMFTLIHDNKVRYSLNEDFFKELILLKCKLYIANYIYRTSYSNITILDSAQYIKNIKNTFNYNEVVELFIFNNKEPLILPSILYEEYIQEGRYLYVRGIESKNSRKEYNHIHRCKDIIQRELDNTYTKGTYEEDICKFIKKLKLNDFFNIMY